MAAPSFSIGPESISVLDGTVVGDYTTVNATVTAVTSGVVSVDHNDEVNSYAELPVSLDMSDRYFYYVALYTENNQRQRVWLSFYDSAGNFKRFDFIDGARRKNYYYIFDLYTAADIFSGTLDVSDISAVRFGLESNNGAYDHELLAIDYLICSEGDTNDPINAKSLFDFIALTYPLPYSNQGSQFESPLRRIIGTLLIPHRIHFEGNVFIDNNSSGGFYFPENPDGDNTSGFALDLFNDTANDSLSGAFFGGSFQVLVFNTSASISIDGQQIFRFGIQDTSSVSNTLSGWTFSQSIGGFLGLLVLTSTSFFNSTGVFVGGSNLNGCSFIGSSSSVAYEWNGSTTFTGNCSFSGNTAHYINFPDSLADGLTFDASSITFGTPTTNIFRADIGVGKTLNITVAAGSGLSISDVTVVSGTVNVVAPQPTVTYTNIPVTGVLLALYDPTTDPDTENAIITSSTLTEHQLTYTAGTSLMRVQAFFPPGTFQRIDLTLPATDQTIDVAGISDADRNYRNPNNTPF